MKYRNTDRHGNISVGQWSGNFGYTTSFILIKENQLTVKILKDWKLAFKLILTDD